MKARTLIGGAVLVLRLLQRYWLRKTKVLRLPKMTWTNYRRRSRH